MKLFRFLSHPYVLIASFLMIVISGEHWATVYVWYVAIAVLKGGVHAMAALLGIALLVVNREVLGKEREELKTVVDLVGAGLLLFSLFVFFKHDTTGYNNATFEETPSQVTLVLFFILTMSFFVRQLLHLKSKPKS